jgi:hypothetical protein
MKNLVPARANIFTGILIEPTILERPKYPIKPIRSHINSGSALYVETTASHYCNDPNTKLVRLSMSLDMSQSMNLDLSYVSLPVRDYPINYGGNYIGDLPDKYEYGHFPGDVIRDEETDALSLIPHSPPVIPSLSCGTFVEDDGTGGWPNLQSYLLGNGGGIVTLDFDTYSLPDRIMVVWNGNVVIDTGWAGSTNPVSASLLNAGLVAHGFPGTASIIQYTTVSGHEGSGSLSWTKPVGFPATVDVYVWSPESGGGSGWSYTLQCPV